MLEYREIEAALGAIVFGPNCDTLEGMQWTAAKLRQAATLLEYRYAVERRYEAQREPAREAAGTVDGQQGQQLAPAKRKRKRGRPARAGTNGTGAADHGPGLASPGTDPLFPEEGAVE